MRDDAGYRASTNTEYLFDGSVAQQLSIQESEEDVVREHYQYTYDHAGRVLNTRYQLNNDEEIILSTFSYDSIGHLVQNLLPNNRDIIRYSYDMRNRLKGNCSKHFSELLFYADHPSEDVHACYNGNVSAIHTAWKDTANTFFYLYDSQNRLLSSKHLTEYSTQPSEAFTYTAEGNLLTLKRFNGTRFVDNLEYDYYNDGNQLLSVTDLGTDADLYGASEFHNGDTQADTTMFYDANGNLVRDLNRGITSIKYNILNLPDTILFSNGNQIVNLYDAAGCKYKSLIYTATPTTECVVTEYTGNTELCYTQTDTISYSIFNNIGYYSDSAYFYYVKDHLGNVCAVVNVDADSVIQRTMYYASGVPMATSTGRDQQPYLYNGKEFVEAHGWHTYDYGFRGYYAPIGRFTSIDPLAESTPWQSPYAYANNNFINAIDWMGLMGVYECVVTDVHGDVINVVNDGDNNIYICLDDTWEPRDGKADLIWVCEMVYSYFWYYSKFKASDYGGGNGGRFNVLSKTQIATAIGRSLIKDVSLGIADNFIRNEFGKRLGSLGHMTINIVANGRTIENLYHIYDYYISQGMSPRVAYDAAKEFLTLGVTAILDGKVEKIINGAIAIAPKMASFAVSAAPYVLATAGVALASWGYYKAGEYFINTVISLNAILNSKGFWANIYGFGDDGSNW